MNGNNQKKLFYEYFSEWAENYKKGNVTDVTMEKYILDAKRIRKIAPELRVEDITRAEYQRLLNVFGEDHEKQTVVDFHHHLRACLLDAVDDGVLEKDPTRKAVMKYKKTGSRKKKKYLSVEELQKLLGALELGKEPDGNWLIWLGAKTGMRFSELLGLTPDDFDLQKRTISISKTWDYKYGTGFAPTKNVSSVRTINMDWETVARMSELLKGLPGDRPIFVKDGGKIYNTTYCDRLHRACQKAGVPEISVHGLRHTHASVLFSSGVSLPSISRRLGHSSTVTTQKVYLHLIAELERKDNALVQGVLAGITGV